MDTRESNLAWLRRLPKVELHLHLEGAIPHGALWELIGKYGGDPSVPTREALAERFAYRDFPHFIDTWVWKNGFLRELEDFTFIAEAVARELASRKVRYAEMFYSPGDFLRFGVDPQRLTEAVRRGLDRVAPVEVALVSDLVRDFGPETASRVLGQIAEVRDFGVVGVGLGGSEQAFPPEPFASVFERARELGFQTTVHAGEAAGAASVWEALRALKPDRIGHGTRAAEDPRLVEHLARQAVPLELCPTSNLRTGAVSSMARHPARIFFEKGIPLSINTDDPSMFGATLEGEYLALMEDLGFSRAEVLMLIGSAIACSWMPAEKKKARTAEFDLDSYSTRDDRIA
jgi:adenosine deaminase